MKKGVLSAKGLIPHIAGLLIVLMNLVGGAKAQVITFEKTFGGTNTDYGISVQQTVDGGYIIAGATTSLGSGNNDVYLIKTDSNGDTLWTKTFGGSGDDWGNSIQQTADGGYIIAGYTDSFGADSNNVYVIKTDAIGDSLWTKTFGGIDDDWGYSVQQTSDGGYIIAGQINYNPWGGSQGNAQVYLIKTDGNGNVYPTNIPNHQLPTTNHQLFPNPFNQSFTITYTLAENSFVSLKLFDITGKLISEIVNQKQNKGEHTFNYDGKYLSEGIYFYQLQTDEGIETRKIVKQ